MDSKRLITEACPRCGRTHDVVEENMSESPLRWFRCPSCAKVWSVARIPKG
jgi:transposase-like protein